MPTRPSARSLQHLRKHGCLAGVVEKWVEFKGSKTDGPSGKRRDLFGFIDIIACGPVVSSPRGCIAVQATTRQQMAKHKREYRRNPDVRLRILTWLACDNTFLLHGWSKFNEPNATKPGTHVRWRLKTEEITAADLELTAADRRAIEAAEAAGVNHGRLDKRGS